MKFLVTYPNLENLSNNATIGDFLALPNSSYPYFWAWILAGIWLITTFTMYFTQKDREARANLLSSMAVSSFAIFVLSTIGSIMGIVSREIFLYIIVICFMVIGIWIFSSRG